jgi:hypothetical protein
MFTKSACPPECDRAFIVDEHIEIHAHIPGHKALTDERDGPKSVSPPAMGPHDEKLSEMDSVVRRPKEGVGNGGAVNGEQQRSILRAEPGAHSSLELYEGHPVQGAFVLDQLAIQLCENGSIVDCGFAHFHVATSSRQPNVSAVQPQGPERSTKCEARALTAASACWTAPAELREIVAHCGRMTQGANEGPVARLEEDVADAVGAVQGANPNMLLGMFSEPLAEAENVVCEPVAVRLGALPEKLCSVPVRGEKVVAGHALRGSNLHLRIERVKLES